MTPAERLFWDATRSKQLGVRCYAQRVLRGYIVDFYVPKWRLAIEIDGGSHRGREKQDLRRAWWLMECGYSVVRIPNRAVETLLPSIIANLRKQFAA